MFKLVSDITHRRRVEGHEIKTRTSFIIIIIIRIFVVLGFVIIIIIFCLFFDF